MTLFSSTPSALFIWDVSRETVVLGSVIGGTPSASLRALGAVAATTADRNLLV
jgi:hypothetical protein